MKRADWAEVVAKRWKVHHLPELKKQGPLLRRGVRLLEEFRPQLQLDPHALPEQPFDLHLLNLNSLYRRSRELYLKQGGVFIPSLVSSPRTLSSPNLLDPVIEFSPIQRELVWSAIDPIASKSTGRLLELRSYCTSLFHEQNHRILWKLLPGAPPDRSGLRRYLNFAESLVITTDMALGDGLGPGLASLFYGMGVIYDPGTTVYQELSRGNPRDRSRSQLKRQYRNYLQASLHATYLILELYSSKDIFKVIRALFPVLEALGMRAAKRSGKLDQAFIQYTNIQWQRRHRHFLVENLCRVNDSTLNLLLNLSEDPLDNRQQYLIAEKWFDLIGL